ncbi:MAG TPA: Crp/Fnr family transcriptional regulator [Acidobacteriaceae bacterium]|nr:Crp/Fnr family transcriptional regulator [Acidobacteriaceae bacterium]
MQLRNDFLRTLGERDRAALVHAGHSVELPSRFTFYEPGELPHSVYFLNTGMASELVRMADGHTMDGSAVGRRGFVGVPAVLDADTSFHHCVMQVPGEGLRVPASLVREMFDASDEFRCLTLRFLEARYVQATQNAACNLLHKMESRLARWLLATRCHTGSNEFQISQEFLSEMVGANRTTVTQTLGTLEREGLIRLDRGVITITNYDGLCDLGCDCYRVIETAFDHITAEPAEESAAGL